MSSQLFAPFSYFAAFAKLRMNSARLARSLQPHNLNRIRCLDSDEMTEFVKLDWYVLFDGGTCLYVSVEVFLV